MSAYDVTALGAAGDGDADDAGAIQDAIDAAHADGGGVVGVPGGEYRVEAPLTLRSGVRIEGEGTGASMIVAAGEGFSAVEGFGTTDDPVTDVGVAHLAIDCSGLGGGEYDTGEKCIYMQHVERGRFVDVLARAAPATGIGVDFLVDSTVRDCVALANGRNCPPGAIGGNGIGIGAGRYAVESVTVVGCNARGNGNNGVMFEAQGPETEDVHSGYMTAVNCTAVDNRVGFRDSADRRVTFLGCSSVGNDLDGVVVSNKADTSFGARDHRIAHCDVDDNGRHGVHVLDCADAATLAIEGNRVTGNGGDGVRVDTGSPTGPYRVDGNTLSDNGGSGAALVGGGSRVRVTDNDAARNGRNAGADGAGIRLDAAGMAPFADATVRGNHSYDDRASPTQHYGVAIVGAHTDAIVTGNNVRANAEGGFDFRDERPAVVANNVT